MLFVVFFLLVLSIFWFIKRHNHSDPSSFPRRKETSLNSGTPSIQHKNKKKPDWVIQEVIRIKAFHPHLGCRSVALIFNNRFENHKTRAETISKSYVANVIKQHHYDIQVVRRKIKSKPAHNIPFNKVWGMDLTFVDGKPIFGAVEHHSRKCLTLQPIKDKRSITLLRALLDILEKYPKPQYIRTDNDKIAGAILNSFAGPKGGAHGCAE